MSQFNPFQRSRMRIEEPLQVVSIEYIGLTNTYNVEYRASRGAANMGLLLKQFAVGTPIVVRDKQLVVREANLTLSNNTVDEVTIRVVAVDFASIFAMAQRPSTPPPACPNVEIRTLAPVIPMPPQKGARKIIL